jgi:integrase
MKLPSYLKVSRHGVFYYRAVLRSRPSLGPSKTHEFTCSLGTCDRRVAAWLSIRISPVINCVLPRIAVAMHGDHGVNAMFDVRRFLKELIAKVRASSVVDDAGAGPTPPVDSPAVQLLAHELMQQLLAQVSLAHHAVVVPGSTLPLPSPAIGDQSHGRSLAAAVQVVPSVESFDTLIERWFEAESSAWANKTKLDYKSIGHRFARFAEQRGVSHPNQVSPQVIDAYKRLLVKEGIALRTVNKHLSGLGSLFKWATKAGYCQLAQSPVANQFYAKSTIRKVSVKRLVFSAADLLKIFNPENLRKLKRPHEFWVLLLCLLQGVRVGEAAQVETQDFIPVPGGWAMFIRPHKTEATERWVPLHPYLIAIGLLDYINDVRRILERDGMLFPYLRFDANNGYGDLPSESLGRYLESLNLPDGERKVLHSARKTVNDRLKQRGVTEEHRSAYIGHAYVSTNSTDYSDPMNTPVLAQIVMPHLQFEIPIDALRVCPGHFDKVIRRELERRRRQLAHKAARAARVGVVADE